jgi:glycine hydroxymethyltransferase
LTESVRRALAGHHERVADGIMLYAGTNVHSPAVAGLHDTALSTRPALGWPGEKAQTAVQEVEHLEVMAAHQVAASMRASYAEVRYLSATMANLAAYIAFTEPGETVATLSRKPAVTPATRTCLGRLVFGD